MFGELITAETWRKAANDESDPEMRDYCLRYAAWVEKNHPDGYVVELTEDERREQQQR